jgi:hypothetical protein
MAEISYFNTSYDEISGVFSNRLKGTVTTLRDVELPGFSSCSTSSCPPNRLVDGTIQLNTSAYAEAMPSSGGKVLSQSIQLVTTRSTCRARQ